MHEIVLPPPLHQLFGRSDVICVQVDLAGLPDSTEGMWLRKQLEFMRIPHIAFRLPCRSVTAATGPTIAPGRPALSGNIRFGFRARLYETRTPL